jgi:hypothetical protein
MSLSPALSSSDALSPPLLVPVYGTFQSDQSQLQLQPLTTNGGGGFGHPLAARGATAIQKNSNIIINYYYYFKDLSGSLIRRSLSASPSITTNSILRRAFSGPYVQPPNYIINKCNNS